MKWTRFFTLPIERTYERRGDPLGFRWMADRIAEDLAPGLSNATDDARWLTIVCWIISRAHKRFPESETSRERSLRAYDWIRPGELLWIAAALETGDGSLGRSLPQQRAVKSWLEHKNRPETLGLSVDAWRRYRYTGPFGIWRPAMRSCGVLRPDGLSLSDDGNRLADHLSELLGSRGCNPWTNNRSGDPVRAWMNNWKGWKCLSDRELPTAKATWRRLGEHSLVRPILFGNGESSERRRAVSKAASASKTRSYAQLVGMLAAKHGERTPKVREFIQWTDAGLHTMNAVWAFANKLCDASGQVPWREIARQNEVKGLLERFTDESRFWAKGTHPFYPGVSKLAKSMVGARSGPDALRRLIAHHEANAQGLRWFRSNSDSLTLIARNSHSSASLYSFRLHALCRVARQSGVIGAVPRALNDSRGFELDE